jgi:hypothetical protein
MVVLIWCGAALGAGEGLDRIEKLSPENQALARRMNDFVQRMDDKYFAQALKMGGRLTENLERETETDDYYVQVIRGPVIEKLGRMVALDKKTPPGRPLPETAWGRFYSLDYHPKSPLVGHLHAVVVLLIFEDGTGFAGGWLAVMNGTRVEADMAKLTAATDRYFAAHDRSPALFHKIISEGDAETVAQWRRQPDPSGVSFYGPPVFPGDLTKSWEFVSGLFEQFVDTYIELIELHQKDAGTPEDLAAQDAMRKRWLADQLFSDPYASKLVPFEIWSLANVPPAVKF